MITQPSDYEFVDFANGTMYTGGFDGNILPLRQNGERNIIKGEDIAFLAECVRDKKGAFNGGKILDGNLPSFAQKFVPTCNLSSSQMLSLRSFMADELSAGFPTTRSIGYLARFPAEIAAFNKSDSDIDATTKFNNLVAYVASTRGGTWSPTTYESDFEVGDKLASAPVAAMFEDAKHLDKPVTLSYTSTDYMQKCSWVQTGGNPVSRPGTLLCGWEMYNDANNPTTLYYQGWHCIPSGSTVTLAEVPDDFLSDAQLWLAYGAYLYEEDMSGNQYLSSAAGLISMDTGGRGLCTKTHRNRKITWSQQTISSTRLIDRIISDCGWTRRTLGSSYYMQSIQVMDPSALILVGVPNDRTKWWS